MLAPPTHPGLRRILAATADSELFDLLTQRLAPSDMATLLLGVFDQRSEEVRPTDLLRRYALDRFVAPAQIDALVLARIELGLERLAMVVAARDQEMSTES